MVQEEPKVLGVNVIYLFIPIVFFMLGFPIVGMSFFMLVWIAISALIYLALFYLENKVEKVNKVYAGKIRQYVESHEHSNVMINVVGYKKQK